MKRLICLALVAVLMLSGCSLKKEQEENKAEEFKWASGAMLRVGSDQIDLREGLVYLDATRKDYEQYYGTDIWNYRIRTNGDTLGVTVKEQVLESIIYVKVVCEKAKEMLVTLSNDEIAEADELAEEYMKSISGSDIEKMGVNEDVVRKIYLDNALARKVFEQATLNVDTNIPNEVAGQHHYYSYAVRNYKVGTNGERVEYTEAERDGIKEKMISTREYIKENYNFYNYAKTRTEDLTMLDIMVGAGDLDPAFESKLMAMKDGEYSDVIEGKNYFYIFYCQTAFDVDATLAKKEEIIAERQEKAFEAFYTDWRSAMKVEVNEAVWNSVDLFTVTLDKGE